MSNVQPSNADAIIVSIDLGSASYISGYGRPEEATAALTQLSDMIESSPIRVLAGLLEKTVQSLILADPQKATKKPGLLSRLMGGAVESRLVYDLARQDVDAFLAKAQAASMNVLEMMEKIDRILASHDDHLQELRDHISAGKRYLAENPTAGSAGDGLETFEVAPRERFSRRLTNLATLLASQEMSTVQLRLAKAQAADLYDRYQDLSQVLVPVWRHHSLSVANRDNLSPEAVRAANVAHEQLMASLTQSLNASKQVGVSH